MLYKAILTDFAIAAKVCEALATHDDMQRMATLYDTDTPDAESIMKIVGGKPALELKASWLTLVNQRALEEEFLGNFLDAQGLEYLNLIVEKTASSCDYDSTVEKYERCRDKVCEMSACRALFKKPKSEETRKSMADKAQAIIKDLGGVLPARLGCLLTAAAAK